MRQGAGPPRTLFPPSAPSPRKPSRPATAPCPGCPSRCPPSPRSHCMSRRVCDRAWRSRRRGRAWKWKVILALNRIFLKLNYLKYSSRCLRESSGPGGCAGRDRAASEHARCSLPAPGRESRARARCLPPARCPSARAPRPVPGALRERAGGWEAERGPEPAAAAGWRSPGWDREARDGPFAICSCPPGPVPGGGGGGLPAVPLYRLGAGVRGLRHPWGGVGGSCSCQGSAAARSRELVYVLYVASR